MFVEKLNEEIIKELFIPCNRIIESCMLCKMGGKSFWNVVYNATTRRLGTTRFVTVITDFEVYFRSAGDGIHPNKSILDEENTEKLREYLTTQDETYQYHLNEHLDEIVAGR